MHLLQTINTAPSNGETVVFSIGYPYKNINLKRCTFLSRIFQSCLQTQEQSIFDQQSPHSPNEDQTRNNDDFEGLLKEGKLVKDETAETGSVNFKVYMEYFKSLSYAFTIIFYCLIVGQVTFKVRVIHNYKWHERIGCLQIPLKFNCNSAKVLV